MLPPLRSIFLRLPFTFPASTGNNSSYKAIILKFTGESNLSLRFFFGTSYLNSAIQFYCQLEEGENATAWSPNANELKNASFEVTDEHARFTSSDGSYTEFVPGQTGLKWHKVNGDAGKDYYYLSQIGEAEIYSGPSSAGYADIQLDPAFKNKDFYITVSFNQTLPSDGMSHTLTGFSCFTAYVSKSNATFRIYGYSAWKDYTGTAKNTITFIAIA